MATTCSVILSLAGGAALTRAPGGAWSVRGPEGDVSLGQPDPALIDAIALLATGATEEDLAARASTAPGASALPRLYHALHQLSQAGLVARTLAWNGASIATLEPLAPACRSSAWEVAPGQRIQLSRFASARREGERWICESPRAQARVVLHDRRAAALLLDLAAPTSIREVAERIPDLPEEVVSRLVSLLADAVLLTPVGEKGSAEDTDPDLRLWEPHDLNLHAWSRRGRPRSPYGRDARTFAAIAPRAVAEPAGAPGIALDRPDIARLMERDVPFTRVVEERRSIRQFGPDPLTIRDLGELLYRAARVRGQGAHTNRPYPGGGACYELEIHPVVRRCNGLDAGLYRYDAEGHRLHLVRPRDELVDALLDGAARSAAITEVQVVLIFAARFERVMSKYAAMSYALILEDTGVLMQTASLVAQAMGLAACPLGAGDAALFARARGVDALVEGSVGEMLLGSR